jgi:hypothetical protein
MSSDIAELLRRPDLYLYAFEGDDALFLEMDRAAYARSIFFDRRISPSGDDLLTVPISQLLAATLPPPGPIGWIFHMAHGGSTLLARALDISGRSLVVREPATLRAIGADAASNMGRPDSDRLRLAVQLLSRRFQDDERVLVKANVPVNAMLPDVLALFDEPKAVLLHSGLEDYLIAILRSENHRNWVAFIFGELGLARHFGSRSGQDIAIVEQAAALWLYQIRRFAEALATHPGLRSLDSNLFFDSPRDCLLAASAYFGFPLSESNVDGLVGGELFATYSKNPAARFDNIDRLNRVMEVRNAIRPELLIARRWIDAHIADTPLPDLLPQPLCGQNRTLL